MAELIQDYVRQIQRYAPLSFEEEQELAIAWRDLRDEKAFHKLMNSYLRLVLKVAISFKGYGLPLDELIQEGNIGLMQAIARFEPDRGFRLSTYAMWWIKASIQEYILNNWSMVKIGTSSTQKKLFFNLRRLRAEMLGEEGIYLSPEAISLIAKELQVSEADVIGMDQRLRHGGDESLNLMVGDDEDGTEKQDFLVETRPNQEDVYARTQIAKLRRIQLQQALDQLDERERAIFVARRLQDEDHTPTLEALSHQYGVSRERVRQLEERAFKKVQKHLDEEGRATLLN